MLRLTLRTLLAYLDDTLDPASSRLIGQKVAENATAQELVDRIKKVTRKRGLSTPPSGGERSPSDPNNVAGYLSDSLTGEQTAQFEMACLESDVLLAEVAACHQVLTLVLSEPMLVPTPARRRMYALVKGRESIPNRPGNITPVGGVVSKEKAEADDHDDGLMLGVPAYSKDKSAARVVLTLLAAAACFLGLGISVFMALPSNIRSTPEESFAAVTPTPTPAPVPTPTPTPKPKDSTIPKPKEVTKEPMPEKKEPEKKEPEKKEPEKKEPEKKEPEKKEQPKNPVDIAPEPQPPKAEKVIMGKLDKAAQNLTLRQAAAADAWTRVTAADSNINTTDKYLAMPGYKPSIRLDSEILIDLWGNIPEFLPAPFFASSITPYSPYPGFDADLAVHAGRIYFQSRKATGGKVRLRFGDEIWDVTIPDDKTRVAFELRKTLSRGNVPEPIQSTAMLAVVSGTKVTVKVRYKDYVVNKDEFLAWDSKGKGVEGPRKADGNNGPKASYFSDQIVPDSAPTRAAFPALEDLARKLTEVRGFRAIYSEALMERPEPPTTQVVVAARIAVYSQATLGDLTTVVESLNDENRQYIREAAVLGLPYALAMHPDMEKELRNILADKARLTEDQVSTAIKLLRGLSDQDLKDPAAVDAVVDALASNSVALRELAFYTLLSDVDREARTIRDLSNFDAGAPEKKREPFVRAWKKRIEDKRKASEK